MRHSSPPVPPATTGPAEFTAHLARLRDWAGAPSLRSLRALGGTTRTPGGDVVDALPTSTISYVLRGCRLPRLPRRVFVEAYVTACLRAAGHPEPLIGPTVAAWLTAWHAARIPAPSASAAGCRLPRDIPDFTGRDGELNRIIAHLAPESGTTRIVTVDGMPGVGKTALAVHAAHRLTGRFPDGRLFADLRGHSPERPPLDAATALGALLRAVGIADAPADPDEAAALWRARTARLDLLLVLDDCRDARQILPLLPGGAGCAVLVTGRPRLLGLDGAATVSLDVLRAPQDARLLAALIADERARSEPAAVEAVAVHCGGLPLALRLAGARLRHRPAWTVADYAASLAGADPLGRLTDGHRSLTAAFHLSYARLPGPARRMFRLVGPHPGDVTAATAAALAGVTEDEAESLLETLDDTHLIRQPRPGRYRTHRLLAAYAGLLRGENRVPPLAAPASFGRTQATSVEEGRPMRTPGTTSR